MDDALHLVAQRHHADVGAGLVAGLGQLTDALAGDGDQDALALVALHQRNHFLGGVGLAQDNGNAGNIAGNQRHAQLTHEGVGQVAALGSLVGSCAMDVLQSFQELCAQSGSDAGFKSVVQTVVPSHLGLDGSHSGLHLAQGGDLFAGNCVVAGQAVGGVGEGHGLALAVLGDGFVNGGYGTVVVVVVTAENSFKKCHGFSSYFSSRSRIALMFRISSIAVGLKS